MSQEGKDEADLLWTRVDEVFPSIMLTLGHQDSQGGQELN